MHLNALRSLKALHIRQRLLPPARPQTLQHREPVLTVGKITEKRLLIAVVDYARVVEKVQVARKDTIAKVAFVAQMDTEDSCALQ